MSKDIKDAVRCKYCHYMPLWWEENANGKWMLWTESGRGHLCKPYLTARKMKALYKREQKNATV